MRLKWKIGLVAGAAVLLVGGGSVVSAMQEADWLRVRLVAAVEEKPAAIWRLTICMSGFCHSRGWKRVACICPAWQRVVAQQRHRRSRRPAQCWMWRKCVRGSGCCRCSAIALFLMMSASFSRMFPCVACRMAGRTGCLRRLCGRKPAGAARPPVRCTGMSVFPRSASPKRMCSGMIRSGARRARSGLSVFRQVIWTAQPHV